MNNPAGILTKLCVFAALAAVTATSASASTDWPMYRHDAALSGVSPGKGAIIKPEVRSEYYLGIPFTATAQDGQVSVPATGDLDGDGKIEAIGFDGKDFHAIDSTGKVVWSYHISNKPLDCQLRIRKLLPDRKGLQVVLFTSTMDGGTGLGFCFAFDKGAANGEVAWRTRPLSGYYVPSMVVDDVDGDGQLEVVLSPHYRVQIFNGQTGALKAEVSWDVGRNYGVLMTRPRKDGPQKDIFIICDFVLHVDCIRYKNGKWTYAWGQKYIEPNMPLPRGREKYIHVGPNPIADIDGDGKDEMVYMMIDAAAGDCWRLIARDCETGRVKADIPGVWLWSVTDFNGDGKPELIYTPTKQKRPKTHCDLCIGRLSGGKIERTAIILGARPVLMDAGAPPTLHTTADEGTRDVLHTDLDHNGKQVFFYTLKSTSGNFDDTVVAAGVDARGAVQVKWNLTSPGHRLNVTYAGPDAAGSSVVRVRDLTAGREVSLNPSGAITAESDIGKPGGLWTIPVAVDLDGDGASEIVVQNAVQEIVAIKPGKAAGDTPTVLWSVPGVAMSDQPGYTLPGAQSPQAGDVDGDGRPEVVFASEDIASGNCALTCMGANGNLKWSYPVKGCPWGGLQAQVDNWTLGRFTGRKGLDVYAGIHMRSKSSGEAWMFRGDTGKPVWRVHGVVTQYASLPFSYLPGVADINGDGTDDVIQCPYTIYWAQSGKTGKPVYPPTWLLAPNIFNKWLAYFSPSPVDLDGDGKLDVYLNSAASTGGGCAGLRANGAGIWIYKRAYADGPPGLGPVGDFDGDGKVDIAIGMLTGHILCLNGADGSRKWQIDVPVNGDIIAADINGDGIMELIFTGQDGIMRAVSGKDGSGVWTIACAGQPIAADVDGDGLLEVVAVDQTHGTLRVIVAEK